MKSHLQATLAAGIAALICSACSPNPGAEGDVTEPIAGTNGQTGADEGATLIANTGEAGADFGGNNVVAKRLRLPDMESLPNENELNAKRPKPDDENGGGVIARPPTQ